MKLRGRKLALYIGIPIAILLIVVLSVGLFYLYRQGREIDKFTSIDSQEIVDGIYSIKGNDYADLYVVKSGDSLIAIDGGEKQNRINSEMNKLNLDPSKVKAVFLTHTDSDHVAGVELFSTATVYISNEEEQMINGEIPRFISIIENKLTVSYSLLVDNQDIEVAGIQVHCILTPGHTPGSMSYVINDKYLFTGDTLSLQNGKVLVFNEFFNMDTNKQKNSITKLSKLANVKYIFTAHYGYSDNYQLSFAQWSGN